MKIEIKLYYVYWAVLGCGLSPVGFRRPRPAPASPFVSHGLPMFSWRVKVGALKNRVRHGEVDQPCSQI